jgi:hypothetical protein
MPHTTHAVIIIIYKNISLPLILYGCEIWSLTFREQNRLKVFGEQGVEENIWT